MIPLLLKTAWAWLAPWLVPLALKALPWLGRAREAAGVAAGALGLPKGLGLPLGAGVLVAVIAVGAAGWLGWSAGRDKAAETKRAIEVACDARILAANERALKDALARAAAAESAAYDARKAADDLEVKAINLAADLDAALKAKPEAAKAVCLPADIAAKLNGGARK